MDLSVNVKTQPIDNASEKITTKTTSLRKRKISSGKLISPATKKRSSMFLQLFFKQKFHCTYRYVLLKWK